MALRQLNFAPFRGTIRNPIFRYHARHPNSPPVLVSPFQRSYISSTRKYAYKALRFFNINEQILREKAYLFTIWRAEDVHTVKKTLESQENNTLTLLERLRLHVYIWNALTRTVFRNMLYIIYRQHQSELHLSQRGIGQAFHRAVAITRRHLWHCRDAEVPGSPNYQIRVTLEELLDRFDRYVRNVATALTATVLAIGANFWEGFKVPLPGH